MGNANSIILAGNYRKLQSKNAGAAGIYPGMLLKETTDGDLIVHATKGGPAEAIVALEDALQGKTKSDVYTVDNIIDAAIAMKGTETQAFLKAGENVAIGAYLMSNGDGTLVAYAASSAVTLPHALAVATEAKDLSASGAVNTLINVRWL